MKRAFLLVSIAAGLAALAVGAAFGQGQQGGAIELLVRATPTGGRAEPVLRLPIYLLRKSFADIQKEAEDSEPKLDLDQFIEGLEVSKELRAWMKRARMAQLTGSEFMRRVTVNDIFSVPEFYEAYIARNAGDVGFPTPKYRESDRERNPQKYARQVEEYRDAARKFLEGNPHTRDGMDLHLVRIDPGQRWSQLEVDRRRRVRNRALELAETRYLVAKAETDLAGRAGFVNVPAGEYWLSTLEGEATAGDVRLRWDTRITVHAGQATRVELSNVNAVQRDRASR